MEVAGRPDPPRETLLVLGRNLAIDAATGEVVTALRHAGLRCILLKGPSVARWLYDDGSPRDYVDTDLLLSPDDFGAAERALSAAGFGLSLAEVSLPHARPLHADTWVRRSDGHMVDLHRNLPGARATAESVWNALSAETDTMTVGGAEVEVLAEPARALLVALHASHHGLEETQPLTDLARALSLLPEAPWRDAAVIAEKVGAAEPFAAGLRLLAEGADLAARLALPVETSVETILRATSAPELALSLDWLLQASGFRVKARLIVRKLVPLPGVMRGRSRLARRGRLGLAAAYGLQPVWLAWHAAPALRAWSVARKKSRQVSAARDGER